MPTENEIEAMSYFVASVIRKREARKKDGLPEEPVPTMEELRQKLIDNIYAPNPLYEKLKKELL